LYQLKKYVLADSVIVLKKRADVPVAQPLDDDEQAVTTKDVILKYTSYGDPNAQPPPSPARFPLPVEDDGSAVTQLRNQLQDLVQTIMGFGGQTPPLGAVAAVTGGEDASQQQQQQQSNTSTTATTHQDPQQQPEVEDDDEEEAEEEEEEIGEPEIDPTALRQLTDMGFVDNRARKALILSRMNGEMAIQWLLENADSPHIDDPIPPQTLRLLSREHASFAADPDLVKKLIDMGFEESEIVTALRASGNNLEGASAWLLGDRDLGGTPSSPDAEYVFVGCLVWLCWIVFLVFFLCFVYVLMT